MQRASERLRTASLMVGLLLVMPTSGCLLPYAALAASQANSSDSSNRVSASDISPERRNYIFEICTNMGEISPRCLEVHGLPQTSAPAYERPDPNRDDIRRCFLRVHEYASDADKTINRLGDVGTMYMEVPQYPKFAADPGTAECFALANKYSNGLFLRELQWEVERSRIENDFGKNFARVCDVRGARITGTKFYAHTQVILPIEAKKSRGTIAITGVVPTYSVLCTGELVEPLLDGKNLVTAPNYEN
jgi:hypothetical protein